MDESLHLFERRLGHFEERLKKIEHYMLWTSVVGTLRLAILLVPVILAVIYIPPFLERYIPIATGFITNLQHQGILKK